MSLTKREILTGLLLPLNLILAGCNSGSATSSASSADEPTQVEIIQAPDANRKPNARITAPQAFISGQIVTLDGRGSSDPDGDTLSFLWRQTQGTIITLIDNTNPVLSFIAPTVAQTTQFTFQLSVQDGELSDTASVNIQISPLVDRASPTIISRSPPPDQRGVATSVQISVSFDEALLEDSVDNQSLTLRQADHYLSGSVSYDNHSHSILFTPDAQLSEESTYTVTLGSTVQDLAGNFATTESWNFTTTSHYNLGQTPQQTIDLCMGPSEKWMLTLVNNARAVSRYCGDTKYPAGASLAWHCNLETAAQGHASSMADNNFFSHTSLDGSNPGDRISATGYIWRAFGENIAAGYADEEAVMDGWLSSPGHCANLMSPRYTEMGAASAQNGSSTYRIYWTQSFASQ